MEYIRLGGRVIAIERSTTGPSLTCASVNSGAMNTPFSSGLPAVTGGTPPYTFSVATGSLVAGLSLNASTGAVIGTPTATGNFSIQVRDSNNVLAGNTCPFTISAALLNITTTTLPAATLGVPYSATLSATGGTPPYTWSVPPGALPSGLVLNNGTISGTPSSSGTFNFTVRVTDNASAIATRPLSITISAPSVNFSISGSSFRIYDTFTISLNTNLPNTWFTMCWRYPSGSQNCSPNWGQTNASGYWSQSGYFPPGLAGAWEEWVIFPGNVTSNHVYFTVRDFANLSISREVFRVGDWFTLSLHTSIPNTSFSMCWVLPIGFQNCAPNWAQTDANGNWTLVGTFTQNELGTWREWVVFPTLNSLNSNMITFTVNP